MVTSEEHRHHNLKGNIVYTIKRSTNDNHSTITRARTLRQASRAILEGTTNGLVTYELADKHTTSIVLTLGKEFHLFSTVGEKSKLIPAQKKINSTLQAAGGIRAVTNPSMLAIS